MHNAKASGKIGKLMNEKGRKNEDVCGMGRSKYPKIQSRRDARNLT
jgi:hypothetical protein